MDPVAMSGAAVAVATVVAVAAVTQRTRARRAEREVRRLERELAAERHAASHDHLTGLPNRRSFHRAGAELVREAGRRPLVAILVDLDDFKQVNDTYGHRAGDEVLAAVARRLAALAGGGLVARLGGDEFVALLDDPAPHGGRIPAYGDRLAETADRIAEVLSAPVPVTGGCNVTVRASVGFATVPAGADLDDVLDRADAAMYRAKASLAQPVPAPRDGGRVADDWSAAGEQRRRVTAVAGEATAWS